ncbi:TraR/DksA C4-type zinc finger protein [Cupriavidus basilensis]
MGSGVSAEACRDGACGEPIPEARRLALPGCQYCVECQARREKGR